uniref:Uncharacterized protein n=1 Tax=Tabanus bromius TaxID=304241 RepID=A0A0K8TPP7_TABBR
MAPKDGDELQCKNRDVAENVIDEDFEEIERVNQSLDSLNSALDDMEKRTDDIRAKLMELLTSNKEIRESIMKENNEMDNNQS